MILTMYVCRVCVCQSIVAVCVCIICAASVTMSICKHCCKASSYRSRFNLTKSFADTCVKFHSRLSANKLILEQIHSIHTTNIRYRMEFLPASQQL